MPEPEREGRKEMFYLTTHSTHFIYGYMASDIWLRTILIVRKETCCHHIGYSFRLTARVLLYAPSHRQNSTYHGLCYTSCGALANPKGKKTSLVSLLCFCFHPHPTDSTRWKINLEMLLLKLIKNALKIYILKIIELIMGKDQMPPKGNLRLSHHRVLLLQQDIFTHFIPLHKMNFKPYRIYYLFF